MFYHRLRASPLQKREQAGGSWLTKATSLVSGKASDRTQVSSPVHHSGYNQKHILWCADAEIPLFPFFSLGGETSRNNPITQSKAEHTSVRILLLLENVKFYK